MERLNVGKTDLLFDFLINQNRLAGKRALIMGVKNVLFSGFKADWKKKNQKFDFSFSFKEPDAGGLRFSYNNFGEKEEFYDKALEVFNLFGNVYAAGKLKSILDELDSKNAVFQTTIGFEWLAEENFPRIKIYFEEIHQELSEPDRIKMAKKVAEIIGFGREALKLKKSDSVGAICVDFLPQKETRLKVYLMSDSADLPYLEKVFRGEKRLIEAAKDFLDVFSAEKSCFYYTARRFGENGLNSVKIYKIYEVGGISDFSKSYEEIFGFLKRSPAEKAVEKFKELLSFALKNKVMFYPVISSVDLSAKTGEKFDLYLSVKF